MTRLLVSALTPRGRGAVATIRLQGDWTALETAGVIRTARGLHPSVAPIGRILLAHWGPPPGEDVVVCRTAEAVLDVHCHGGEAAVARILADAEAHGAQPCGAQEFLQRTQGFFQAECLEAVAHAPTLRTAALLLEQSTGRLRDAIQNLVLNYDPQRLDDLLQWSEFGRHLTAPWQVVLTGAPNVGKSSLINRLVGYERSIVCAEPGTTRDVVTAETALDGWPVRFEDTAGLRDGATPLEEQGIARARQQLRQADLVLIVYDVSLGLSEADRALCHEYPAALLVGNKCDLEPTAASARELSVSCLTGIGMEQLIGAIVSRLVPTVPEPLQGVPLTDRQIRLLQAARSTNSVGPLRELLGACRS